MPKGYRYTLLDIGLVINQLMGSGYCSTYVRRKFRNEYTHAQTTTKSKTVVTFASNTTNNGDLKAPTLFEKLRKGSKATVTDSAGSHSPYEQRDSIVPNNHLDDIHFEYPFSELMIWAVLTKRQPMARLMWQHGEQAMAKALVASRLYQGLL